MIIALGWHHWLKTFQAHLSSPKEREIFHEEVYKWVQLEKHPNIVRCYHMDTLANQPFMFLEWVVGKEEWGTDLRSWLRRGPLSLQLALYFTIDVCRGLIHAQEKQRGMVHRDPSPGNILIGQAGTGEYIAKITDFGLATVAQETGMELADESDASRVSLAKERENRFATLDELLAQLTALYEQLFAHPPKPLAASTDFTAADYNNRGHTLDALVRSSEALGSEEVPYN